MKVGKYTVRLFLVASNESPPVGRALCGEFEGSIVLDKERTRFEAQIRKGVCATMRPVLKQSGDVSPIRSIFPGDPLYGRTPTGWDLESEGWLETAA